MAYSAYLVVLLSSASLAGCTTSQANPTNGPGGCVAFVPDADLSMPAVSFTSDVMPIFQSSCSFTGTGCHGEPSVATDVVSPRPFLGYVDGDAAQGDAGAIMTAQVVAGIVGVKSREDPSMDRIAPSDPARSFLMHKMDGDQCTLMAECEVDGSTRPNCGVFMPYQAPSVLDLPTRDTVRRWIAQGAR